MATLTRFEQLKVWQDARSFDQKLFSFIKHADDKSDGFLKNHILKTSGSIMDNIAEGFEREGNKEFIQFLSYSKGSAGELRSQLYRAMDHEMINQNNFDQLIDPLLSLSQQLSNFMNYLKNSPLKGNKFNEGRASYSNDQEIDNFITD
jgi:four helix bundle protein